MGFFYSIHLLHIALNIIRVPNLLFDICKIKCKSLIVSENLLNYSDATYDDPVLNIVALITHSLFGRGDIHSMDLMPIA